MAQLKKITIPLCVLVIAASIFAQYPSSVSNHGKQVVLNGREFLAFDSAKAIFAKMPLSAKQKDLNSYWIGISEDQNKYYFAFFPKPVQGQRFTDSSRPKLIGREFRIEVDKDTLRASKPISHG